MSFFGNLFGGKLEEVNINELNVQSSDPVVTRASNMLIGAGLGTHAEFLTLVDKVVTIMLRYQEVDVGATVASIKKAETVSAKVTTTIKKEPKSKKPKVKKAESDVAPITDTAMTITPAKSTKKSTKTAKPTKRVYNRKTTTQKMVD